MIAHAVGLEGRVELNVRRVFDHEVVDILPPRGWGGAIIVCVRCRAQWNEGAMYVPACLPCKLGEVHAAH